MRIRVLGSAAGGGVPQWNCACENCVAARNVTGEVTPRSQSSLAVSADGERWLLLNASPDVRTQLASFLALAPPSGQLRGSAIAAVALTNADIDHCAGLLVLREGGAPPIYGTARVRDALTRGLRILPVLESYGPVDWRAFALDTDHAMLGRDAREIGLRVTPFAVASKPPPYMLPFLSESEARDDRAGDTVGLTLTDASGARATYVPGVRDLDAALERELARADVILIDGTFATDDELVARGASTKTARMMGHAPLTGAGGLVEFLQRFARARRVLVHINNSNPILREGSEMRRMVERAGIEIAHDGMELAIGAAAG